MFLNRQTPVEMFFSQDGSPHYRMDHKTSPCWSYDRHRRCKGHRGIYECIQHNTASMFWTLPTISRTPMDFRCFQIIHHMKPLTRSGYRRSRAMFPDAFDRLTRARFRSSSDFSPTVLIPNLEVAHGHAILETNFPQSDQIYLEVAYLPRIQRNFWYLQGRLQNCYLLCLNNANREWHGSWITKNFQLDQSKCCSGSWYPCSYINEPHNRSNTGAFRGLALARASAPTEGAQHQTWETYNVLFGPWVAHIIFESTRWDTNVI
jgi:hypothetical protein